MDIDVKEINLEPFRVFNDGWMLLASGDYASENWNCMTVSWGFLGTMWNLPVAQVVVRPQRHTRKFLDKYGNFTLSSFPAGYKDKLTVLGRFSGTQMDKVHDSGFTPRSSVCVSSPSFAEAALTLECKVMFAQRMSPESMLDERAAAAYPEHDEHFIYIGEIKRAAVAG